MGVARLLRLVEMKREVEMDTRQEVIKSMEESSLPEWQVGIIHFMVICKLAHKQFGPKQLLSGPKTF